MNTDEIYSCEYAEMLHMKKTNKEPMKHKNLYKSLEKIAPIVIYRHDKGQLANQPETSYEVRWYRCQKGVRVVEWHSTLQDDHSNAHCVSIRHEDDKDNLMADYNAGIFVDTIKQCKEYLNKE